VTPRLYGVWQVQVIGASPEYWSAMSSSPTSYTVTTGTVLTFRYSTSHNLYLMGSKAAYDSCDLAASVELAGSNFGGEEAGSGDQPAMPANKYEVVMAASGTYYMVCHVPGHCSSGQKITVQVVDESSSSGGCGGGCIGGIVGGSFVPVLMLVLWLSGAFGAKCPSPLRPGPPANAVMGPKDAASEVSPA
jgi:plastocyanin